MITVKLIGGPAHGREDMIDSNQSVVLWRQYPPITTWSLADVTADNERGAIDHTYEVHAIHQGNPETTIAFAFHESHRGQPFAQVLWEYAKQVKP